MVSLTATLLGVMQRRTLVPGFVENALTGRGQAMSGRTVVVTGASGGIGRVAAHRLAADGARVIAVARRADELRSLASETGCDYRVADLSDESEVDALCGDLADFEVDVLVNNAGRSIRRTILDSTDRLHDYRRTMALNYFAPVQLSLGLLPGMIERGRGQFVNVCTWGVMAGTFPRFSAYAASKSALDIFGRSLNAECPHPGVRATNVYFPLVRTEMIAPTTEYDGITALTPDEAAAWIVRAITHRPERIAPAAVRAVLPMMDYLAPGIADRAMGALT